MKLFWFTAIMLCVGCSSQVAIDDLTTPPKETPSDTKFTNAFKMLDGEWRGVFKIYVDSRGQQDGPSQPKLFDPDEWQSAPYELSGTLSVRQVYESESPFFQTVKITDTYPDGKVVESTGVNKIQDGKMWCVVKKPDDLVIHDGELEDPQTILWSRTRTTPQAIEFFRETVEGSTYRIVGWGYYGNDDPNKAPRMFFDATYDRQ